MKRQKKALAIVYNSVFIVISLILGLIGKISIFPIFPFLTLDFSDIPVVLATLISGSTAGVVVLFVVSALRAITFSSAGWIGFIIRLTSMVIIFGLEIFWRKQFNKFYKIFGIVISVILCLTIKLIINYCLWINMFGISKDLLNGLMLSIIVPYNVAKIIITLTFSLLLEKPIKNVIDMTE